MAARRGRISARAGAAMNRAGGAALARQPLGTKGLGGRSATAGQRYAMGAALNAAGGAALAKAAGGRSAASAAGSSSSKS